MSNLFCTLINEGGRLFLNKLRLTEIMGILFFYHMQYDSLFHMKITECYKKLASRSWTVLLTLADFFLINTFCYSAIR